MSASSLVLNSRGIAHVESPLTEQERAFAKSELNGYAKMFAVIGALTLFISGFLLGIAFGGGSCLAPPCVMGSLFGAVSLSFISIAILAKKAMYSINEKTTFSELSQRWVVSAGIVPIRQT